MALLLEIWRPGIHEIGDSHGRFSFYFFVKPLSATCPSQESFILLLLISLLLLVATVFSLLCFAFSVKFSLKKTLVIMKSEKGTIFSKSSLLIKNQRPKKQKEDGKKNPLMILSWKPERRLKTKQNKRPGK